MIYWLAANLVVSIHFLFICFVLLGGLLAYRWWWVIFLHLPAAFWGAWVEYRGIVCPLTPLENHLWRAGGEQGYSGGFIENYLVPLIYLEGPDRNLQILLGTVVVAVNVLVYAGLVVFIIIRQRKN